VSVSESVVSGDGIANTSYRTDWEYRCANGVTVETTTWEGIYDEK